MKQSIPAIFILGLIASVAAPGCATREETTGTPVAYVPAPPPAEAVTPAAPAAPEPSVKPAAPDPSVKPAEPEPSVTPAEPESPAMPAVPEAPAKPPETDGQALERMTGEMMKKVEELRGLKFKHDVKRVWKSRDEAKTEMLAEIDKQIPADKVLAISKQMVLFGLLPEGSNIKEIFSEFISAGAGGYYNPDTKTFSLVRGFPEDASRPIVFHELVHALEDQYYDYNARQEAYSDADQSDGSAAVQAVVEGSARYWEDVFVASEPGLRKRYFQASMESQAGDGTMQRQLELPPAIIIAMVMYPYGNGCDFHQALIPATKAATDRAWFDAVYASPPSSTEQILHPMKYVQGDLPAAVKLPALEGVLGEGWKSLGQDTQGELGMGLVVNATMLPNNMLAQASMAMKMPTGKMSGDEMIRFQMTPVVQFKGGTARGIEGWDGDRFEVFENGTRLCLAWVSTWDSPADAQEFAAEYGRVIAKKYTTSAEVEGEKVRTPPESSPFKAGEAAGTRWAKTREGDSAVAVQGNLVVVLERAPAEGLEALATALLKAEVVRDAKDTLPAR